REHVGEHVVRIREPVAHRGGVDLLDHARLAVDGQRRRGRGDEVLVAIDVLEPEHEVVGGEWLAVAPLHAAPQVQEPRLPALLHLEALGGGWDRTVRTVNPKNMAGPAPDRGGNPYKNPPALGPRPHRSPPYLPISFSGLMTSGSWPTRSPT